ncbi:MAG: undecaprenyl-diphosphate phosphatase [Acidobacteria bacterium]|nr:undecaprenyl-diphosphate phosphatase [Acidobacteriota bacterium]
MELISAAILGVIQGLTEFLPISSSAHLIIVPWFIGWEAQGIAFDVSLHVGTAISVLAFFWKDWIRLARETINGLKEGRPLGNSDRKLAWFLVVATIPAAIAGLLFEDSIENRWRSPLVTVFTLVVFAILLYIADKKGKRNRSISSFKWADSIWIGLSQAVALIPGVSRSGITMTAAMLRNSDRTSAARFSFLLSTPVIVGAGALEGLKLIRSILNPLEGTVEEQWFVLLTGVVFAAVTGFLCIRYFLRYIRNSSFTPFVVYRILLAGVVLAYYLKGQ